MSLSKRLAIKYVRAKFKLLSNISKRKAAEKAFELFCTPQYKNIKKLPATFEKAEKMHFTIEDAIVRGYRWNHPSAKKLLILHGFESTVINFERYVNPAIKKGYEVLAFDAPAHGYSSGKKITVLTYKKMIQHIDTHYGPVTAFMAHSLGGLTVSLFLEEKEHDSSYKLVLIAPAAETTTAANHFFSVLKLDAEVRNEFDQVISEMNTHPPEWYSLVRAAKNIKAQVLFLQDEDDEMTPLKDVKPIMAANYPNFEFIISKGLGHRRIYRDNKSFQSIIDFL
jgi:pimeloyl-ACP methyl ester carboxylesterase